MPRQPKHLFGPNDAPMGEKKSFPPQAIRNRGVHDHPFIELGQSREQMCAMTET